ncbi:MAG: RHS repeat protein [Planctomycetes bacterium]|nr:RHS repeat protein [Planctomycetota bacterium]
MTASYAYYANGLLQSVTYGNNAATLYTYDDARRLTVIHHKDAVGSTILKLDYTDNDLVASITESDQVGLVAAVTAGGRRMVSTLVSSMIASKQRRIRIRSRGFGFPRKGFAGSSKRKVGESCKPACREP